MGNPANQVLVKIDGQDYRVDEGITVLEAAKQNDIRIPTLCHHPILSSWGGCRLCVVSVDGSPRLSASCVTPVRDGMDIVTSNPNIIESRRMILEFLFAERNHNCMFCPQSGDCDLQSLAYEYQMDHLTVLHAEKSFPVDVAHRYIGLDHNRCILCGRCVRACREIAGNYVLDFRNRGSESLISLDLDETRERSSCTGCGACVQVCPTGALYNRYSTHYAVKGHARDCQTIAGVCHLCGFLCPTTAYVRDNRVLKINGVLSVNGDRPDRGQLCRRGRFEIFRQPGKRFLAPMLKNKQGEWERVGFNQAIESVKENLREIKDRHGADRLIGIASSQCSTEELVVFGRLMSSWGVTRMDTIDGNAIRSMVSIWEAINDTEKEISWKQLPDADFIVALGAGRLETQPLLSSLIRKSIVERKLPLAIIGSEDFQQPFTTYHLPVTPEQMPTFVHAFAAQLQKKESARFLDSIGVDGENRTTFHDMCAHLARASRPVLIVGEEIVGAQQGDARQAALKLAELKNGSDTSALRYLFLKPHGNSAAAIKLGYPAFPGILDASTISGGVLLLTGNENLSAHVLAALEGLDFLVVIAPYFLEKLADRAHVCLPRPTLLEEDGSFTSSDGSAVVLKPKVLAAPAEIKSTWETLSAVFQGQGLQPAHAGWQALNTDVPRLLEQGNYLKTLI